MRISRVPAGVPAGTLATMTVDLAMVAAARFGGVALERRVLAFLDLVAPRRPGARRG